MSEPGSRLGSKAPWPPAMITARLRSCGVRGVVRVQDDDVVLPLDRLDGRLEVDRDVELLECLAAQLLDEVLGEHLRVTGDVEDPLLRVQRRQLAADLRQRVDDPRRGLAHAGPERGREPDRARPDDGDVADLAGLVPVHQASSAASASPSSADSARSTDVLMHVKVGVSRFV